MRSLARFSSILTLLALPLVASLPNRPFYPKRFFLDISNQLENRAYLQDVSQFNFAPFNVTELSILCLRLNITRDYSCNLTFNWFDPNSVRQNSVNSGSCQTAWRWDGATKINASYDGSNAAADYKSCWVDDDTYFKVAVPNFWHPGNFSLELAHRYRDDENFTKPWNYPTTFADVKVDLCEEQPLTDSMYHYHPGPINGTVIGLVD